MFGFGKSRKKLKDVIFDLAKRLAAAELDTENLKQSLENVSFHLKGRFDTAGIGDLRDRLWKLEKLGQPSKTEIQAACDSVRKTAKDLVSVMVTEQMGGAFEQLRCEVLTDISVTRSAAKQSRSDAANASDLASKLAIEVETLTKVVAEALAVLDLDLNFDAEGHYLGISKKKKGGKK